MITILLKNDFIQLKKKYPHIIKNYMFSFCRVITITEQTLAPIICQPSFSTFIITNQDTSTTSYPTVMVTKCNNVICLEKNCVKDNSQCDIDTEYSAIMAHLTHSLKGVEPDKETVELDENTYVVMHDEEKVPHAYEDYKYKESMLVQKDENTQKLNEVLSNKHEHED